MSRTAEEWGRVAVGLEGFGWRPGMYPLVPDEHEPGEWVSEERVWQTQGGHLAVSDYAVPWPDDPATAGCLLVLLGDGWCMQHHDDGWQVWGEVCGEFFRQPTLGRACIAAAEALGRWPGGSND